MNVEEAVKRLRRAYFERDMNGAYEGLAIGTTHTADVKSLLTAYEAREADSKRLDFLESTLTGVSHYCSWPDNKPMGWEYDSLGSAFERETSKATAREAIDAAIAVLKTENTTS